jgi:uncharacterized protein YbjQ (UPF0145 family)
MIHTCVRRAEIPNPHAERPRGAPRQTKTSHGSSNPPPTYAFRRVAPLLRDPSFASQRETRVRTAICVRIGCRLKGVPTEDDICQSCGSKTHTDIVTYPDGPSTSPATGPAPVLVVTTNDIPGHTVVKVFGDVFGLTVRARNYFSNLGAQFRTMVGGEVVGYTKLLAQSRHEARLRLMAEARNLGANAVLAMRFDCNEIGDIMTEIAAYGTAVLVHPVVAGESP